MKQTVGIVGVGGMGGGVATRLLNEGWPVSLWNRSSGALDAFAGREGATIAATPAEAAQSGLVISFVANDAALTEVTASQSGIFAGLPQGGVHVSMSSVSPGLIVKLAAAHDEAGQSLIGAPVFGRPEAAANGLLWIAVSGPGDAIAKAEPMLKAVSRSLHHFGETAEMALKAKIAGNFLIASAIEAMSEAFAMLERSGADPRAFHEMMSETIFGSVIHQNYGRIILDESFLPPGFKLALGGKDVGLAMDMAAKTGTQMPFGEILKARFDVAEAAGLGEADWNAISLLVRRDHQ